MTSTPFHFQTTFNKLLSNCIELYFFLKHEGQIDPLSEIATLKKPNLIRVKKI